jgi:flagellar basal-body rod modification protein FlgD
MSAISSSLGGTGGVPSSSDAFGAMSSQEFLEIIFTELQAQDPLQPNDTGALLEQLGTIRAIESDIALSASIEELVRQNEVSAASSLVGAFVTGYDQFGSQAAGFVDSVLVTDDGSLLSLSDGSIMALDSVTEIIDPALIGVSGGGDEGEEPAPDDAAPGDEEGEPAPEDDPAEVEDEKKEEGA